MKTQERLAYAGTMRRVALCVLVGGIAIARTAAQSMNIDPAFAPVLIDHGFDGLQSTTLFPLADGRLFALGSFTYAGAGPGHGIARLTADGAHDPTLASPETSGATTAANLLIPLTTGGYLAVETLAPSIPVTSVPGMPNFRLTRFTAEGLPDATYPPLTSQGDLTQATNTLDGRVLLLGRFTAIDGHARTGLARLNTDGTLDTSYAPMVPDGFFGFSSLVVDRDGALTATGLTSTDGIALRFRPDGTADPMFHADLAALGWPSLLAAQPDGRLLLTAENKLLRMNTDGSMDATFAYTLPLLPGDTIQPLGISRVLVLDDGRVVMESHHSGWPSSAASTVRVLDSTGALLIDLRDTLDENGELRLQALLPDGNVLLRRATVAANPGTVLPFLTYQYSQVRFVRVTPEGDRLAEFTLQVGRAGAVARVVPQAEDALLISGDFDVVNGVTSPGLALLREDGSLDPTFVLPEAGGSRFELEVVQPDGRLMVNTSVADVSGSRPVKRRLLATGAMDASFDATSAAANNLGRIFSVDDQGRLLAAIQDAIANPYAGVPVAMRLATYRTDGSLEREYPLQFAQDPRRGINPRLPLLADVQRLTDGGLLVAGTFDTVEGRTAPGLARLRADGSLDPDFHFSISADGVFSAPRLLTGGRALVDYHLPIIDGSEPRTLRLLADGSVDPDFLSRPGAFFASAHEQPDGSLLSFVAEAVEDRYIDVSRMQRHRVDGTDDPRYRANFDTYREAPFTRPFEPQVPPAMRDAALLPDGRVYAAGSFRSVDGASRAGIVRLVPSTTNSGILDLTIPATVIAGHDAFLAVEVGDAGPVGYQWQRNGVDVPGATNAALVLRHITAAQAGTYRVVVQAGTATHTSNTVVLTVAPNTARLANFSARSRVHPARPPQIAGFITHSTLSRPVLLRAIGRGLSWQSPEETLPVPVLSLYRGDSEIGRAQETALRPEMVNVANRVGAFAPYLDWPVYRGPDFACRDAALLADLTSETFTAQTTGADGREGISLFEFYDAAMTPTPDFVRNVSLRGHSAPGVNTMIGGLAVAGNGALTLLVRVVGPELAHWNVPDALMDPELVLFSGSQILAHNDDWEASTAANATAIRQGEIATGAFPLDPGSRSAALVATVAPGTYTVHATGAGGTAGEVLLEIYVIEE